MVLLTHVTIEVGLNHIAVNEWAVICVCVFVCSLMLQPLYSPSQVPSVLSSTPPTIAAVAAAAAASRQNLLAAYGIGSSTPQLSVPVTAQMWQGHTALTQGQTVASHSLGNYLYHFSPAAHSSQNELGRRQQGQQLQQQALNQEMVGERAMSVHAYVFS